MIIELANCRHRWCGAAKICCPAHAGDRSGGCHKPDQEPQHVSKKRPVLSTGAVGLESPTYYQQHVSKKRPVILAGRICPARRDRFSLPTSLRGRRPGQDGSRYQRFLEDPLHAATTSRQNGGGTTNRRTGQVPVAQPRHDPAARRLAERRFRRLDLVAQPGSSLSGAAAGMAQAPRPGLRLLGAGLQHRLSGAPGHAWQVRGAGPCPGGRSFALPCLPRRRGRLSERNRGDTGRHAPRRNPP